MVKVAVATASAGALVMFVVMKRKRELLKKSKIRVKDIIVYPLKSAKGLSLKDGILDGESGLKYDRLWMAVDNRGAFLSQRRAPKLALIEPEVIDGSGLRLKASGVETIDVPFLCKEMRNVRCWNDTVVAADQGDDIAAWLETFLGVDGCRLVKMVSTSTRYVDPKYAPRGTRTAFSDGFPLLIASVKSLEDLNNRIGKDGVPMNRFRANVVVDGELAPWAEDTWSKIQIGSQKFLVAKPCARCKMPTIDQDTGVPGGEKTNGETKEDDLGGGPNEGIEPTATLKTFRTGKHLGFLPKYYDEVFFGQNLCHLPSFFSFNNKSFFRVGDGLIVLKYKY